MKKSEFKEIIRVTGASLLSIVVLGAAFIGSNQVVFAHTTSQTVQLPNITATAVVPQQNVLPEDFQVPSMTVIDQWSERASAITSFSKDDNAMTVQAAAELGAHYVMEVFGVNIEGSAVSMMYMPHPFTTRRTWVGRVADSVEQLNNHELSFVFSLDSVTGQRISIEDTRDFDTDLEIEVSIYNRNDYIAPPDNIDEFAQLAEQFAAKHFNQTEIESVEFVRALLTPISSNWNRQAFAKGTTLQFNATDETGREATVNIYMEAGRLHNIDTQHNDFIPGIDGVWSTPQGSRSLSEAEIAEIEARNIERGNSMAYIRVEGDNREDARYEETGLTFNELIEIRGNPDHPRYNELFGNARGGVFGTSPDSQRRTR